MSPRGHEHTINVDRAAAMAWVSGEVAGLGEMSDGGSRRQRSFRVVVLRFGTRVATALVGVASCAQR